MIFFGKQCSCDITADFASVCHWASVCLEGNHQNPSESLVLTDTSGCQRWNSRWKCRGRQGKGGEERGRDREEEERRETALSPLKCK